VDSDLPDEGDCHIGKFQAVEVLEQAVVGGIRCPPHDPVRAAGFLLEVPDECYLPSVAGRVLPAR
jgi:hypothetical protein